MPSATTSLVPRGDDSLQRWLARPPKRLSLATLPTPVERCTALDRGRASVWVKRDDQSSPIYGGGKVRKLEYVLANPPHDGDTPVLSLGGTGSHHLLAVALFLAETGRTLHALTFDQVMTPHVRTGLAVLASLGTQFWHSRTRAGIPLAWLRYQLWQRPTRRGVYMPPGASDGLGGLGFVAAGQELATQIAAGELPHPGRIYVTGGSAGTSAGLAIGLAAAGIATHIRIISAVETIGFNRLMYTRMLAQIFTCMRKHGFDRGGRVGAFLREAGVTWSIDHSQVGPGYAVPTAAGKQALATASNGGLNLETTYTGKCVAAMLKELETIDGPVLFWNTHAANDLRPRIVEGWESKLPPVLARAVRLD